MQAAHLQACSTSKRHGTDPQEHAQWYTIVLTTGLDYKTQLLILLD